MRFWFLTMLGLAATVTLTAADAVDAANSSDVAVDGAPAEEHRDFILIEDDNGVLQKGYVSDPDFAFSVPSPDVLPELIKFHLWTRQTNDTEGERLFVGDNETLLASTFNHSNPTKFIVHGFTNTIKSKAIQDPKNAYLDRGEYNVIGVDWGSMCGAPWYSIAKSNSYVVGEFVGKMIKFLVETGGASLDDIHLIGHSLGAHVCGVAGASLGEDKVARITGLDPAGPLFYSSGPEERLDPTDAKFVDAIHTCGGYSLPKLGLMDPTAMADFYPNGGINTQPSCEALFEWMSIPCSHSNAYKIWAETVTQPRRDKFKFFGPASSLAEMGSLKFGGEAESLGFIGEDTPNTMRGIFWLSTA